MELKTSPIRLCLGTFLLLSFGLGSSVVSAKVVYKWSDDEGVIHYTATPPEKRGHKAINSDGLIVGEQAAPATPEERIEREKQAAIEKELALEESREKRRGRLLLATYRSERDIEARLQAVLKNIENEIKIATRAYDAQNRLLGIQVQRAANLQRQGKPVTQANKDLIQQQQIKTNEQLTNISKLQENMGTERTNFAHDLARYRSFNRIDDS